MREMMFGKPNIFEKSRELYFDAEEWTFFEMEPNYGSIPAFEDQCGMRNGRSCADTNQEPLLTRVGREDGQFPQPKRGCSKCLLIVLLNLLILGLLFFVTIILTNGTFSPVSQCHVSCRKKASYKSETELQNEGESFSKKNQYKISVRLVNSTIGKVPVSAGRLEIFMDGSWKTVCHRGIDDNTAKVVCVSLGFYINSVPHIVDSSVFGSGQAQQMIDRMNCNDTEYDLTQCSYAQWPDVTACQSSNSVGLVCGSYTPIRVHGSTKSISDGQVEIYHQGSWGLVCLKSYTTHRRRSFAKVVCRMLGWPNDLSIATQRTIISRNMNQTVLLSKVRCVGDELDIDMCSHLPWNIRTCPVSDSVTVTCRSARLANRANSSAGSWFGRLEVFQDGQWGTVCDNQFTESDAKVACRMLGLPTRNPVVKRRAFYGEGSGPIWLRNYRNCKGDEQDLWHCKTFEAVRVCFHNEDVGIICKE